MKQPRGEFDWLIQIARPPATVSQRRTSLFEIRAQLDKPPDLRMSDKALLRFLSAASLQPFIALTILLNHLLQIIRYFRQRFQSDFHVAIPGLANDGVYLRETLVLLG